jgi:hypothetical protein
MFSSRGISRREFVQSTSPASAAGLIPTFRIPGFAATVSFPPLDEFGYGDVTLASDLHEKRFAETHASGNATNVSVRLRS